MNNCEICKKVLPELKKKFFLLMAGREFECPEGEVKISCYYKWNPVNWDQATKLIESYEREHGKIST